jgi:hypothetical protein
LFSITILTAFVLSYDIPLGLSMRWQRPSLVPQIVVPPLQPIQYVI